MQTYGNAWELLWVGHYGDAIPWPTVISTLDVTLPPTANYRENNGRQMHLTSKPQHRLIHMAHEPVSDCLALWLILTLAFILRHNKNAD